MKFEIGDVFSRTFSFVSQEAGALISIVVLTYILPAILIYIMPFAFFGLDLYGLSDEADTLLVGFTGSILDIIASTFSQVILLLFTAARYKDIEFKNISALTFGIKNILPLIAISIIYYFAVGLGMILFIIPGIIIALGLSISSQVFISEPKKGISAAIKRSWDLTRGHRLSLIPIYMPAILAAALYVTVTEFVPDLFNNPYVTMLSYIVSTALTASIFYILGFFIYTTLREARLRTHNQKSTVAASAMADRKTVGHLS